MTSVFGFTVFLDIALVGFVCFEDCVFCLLDPFLVFFDCVFVSLDLDFCLFLCVNAKNQFMSHLDPASPSLQDMSLQMDPADVTKLQAIVA